MERYFSTGQSAQQAVAPTEEEEDDEEEEKVLNSEQTAIISLYLKTGFYN
jgi:hypothetical protein